MEIDVIDLKLKALKFTIKKDERRTARARSIYNKELVRITEVDKLEEDKYIVKAVVEGNYDNYTTTLKINNGIVTESKCTCEDTENGYLCKHTIATAMETINPHYASTEEGRKRLIEQRQKEIEERRKQEEIERRKIIEQYEYSHKYSEGIKTIEEFKENIVEEKSLNLDSIYEDSQINNVKHELSTSLNLDYEVEILNQYSFKLAFKVGEKRMYRIADLIEFYRAYKNEKELTYGKLLSFIPKRENFEPKSQLLFDYIIKYAEMVYYNKDINQYNSSDYKKYIYINQFNMDDFFNMNLNKYISIKFNRYVVHQFKVLNEKIDIGYKFSKEDVETYSYYVNKEKSNEYVLRVNLDDYFILYSNTSLYVLYENNIYKNKKEADSVNILRLIDKDKNILIPEDRLEDFFKYVAPQLKNLEISDVPQKYEEKKVEKVDLACKIMLDTDDYGNIILELRFCYGDTEFNVLDSKSLEDKEINLISRDIKEERKTIERIFSDGFTYSEKEQFFKLQNDDDIYEFLLNKIPGYMEDYEVMVTDKFKNKEIKRPKISNIGIKVDNGLLQMDLSRINIDLDEIKDVMKKYKIKKKYYKLKNGDYLDLTNNKDLDLLDEMSDTLDLDYSKINSGNIKVPINRSYYLENLLNENKQIGVSKDSEFNKIIDNMQNKDIEKEIKLDEELEGKLRDYQKVGYKWLKTLSMYHFGGILADDMGLGKTLQVISLLKSELNIERTDPSIVVCPSTLVLNWKSEIEKWCPSIKVLIVNGMAEERTQKIEDYAKYDLLITSYDSLKRDINKYEGKKFKYIIADEAQYIKNASTQNATSLKSLEGEIKYALTGTPIENSIAELWSIFDYIMPGYLYNYNKFKKKFEEPILKLEDKQTLQRLKKLIAPFILRRVKKDVLTELPEKNITILKNEMEDEQRKIYLSYLAQTKKEVTEELQQNGFEKSKFKILMLLTRLRQICCHPGLFIENYNEDSGKLKQCMNLVQDAIEGGHKILLFSSYTSMFKIIEEEFKKSNINYYKLVGKTPVSQRIDMVDSFNKNDDVKVFLISLKAGGTGLNLTSADVVIHYDPWWNVSSENQATDRAYRIGQKNSVQVYKLITSNSIEEKINKMQETKEKLSKDILSNEETFVNRLSREEIMDLFE